MPSTTGTDCVAGCDAGSCAVQTDTIDAGDEITAYDTTTNKRENRIWPRLCRVTASTATGNERVFVAWASRASYARSRMKPAPSLHACYVLFLSLAIAGCRKSKDRDDSASPALSAAPATAPVSAPPPAPLRTSPGAYRPMPMRVLAVDERSLTVRQRFFIDGQPPPTDQTLVLDPRRTQVFAHDVTSQRENEQRQIVMTTKSKPVTFAELKVGQTVHLAADEQGVAIDVIILPPPPDRPTTRRTPTTRRRGPATTPPTTRTR